MATINLRPVADTVLVGQDVRTINGAAAALIGNLLDGLGGADVIIADDFYPASSHFTLSADTTGILTMTTASGTIKFKNFETIQFQNLSVKLGTAANDIITGTSKADAFLFGAAGNDTINGGAGADKMYGGLGNDIFTIETVGDTAIEAAAQGIDLVKSSITHTLGLNVENLTLSGATAINGTGNALANVLTGNNGANILSGAAGNDTIAGGIGNDKLLGGLGNDKLTGGLGNDTFVFNTAANAVLNKDTIADYNVVADTIQLENAVFTALGAATGVLTAAKFFTGAAAHDADDRIIYNKTTGALFYDSNGNGAGGSVQIATLTVHAALTNADFIII